MIRKKGLGFLLAIFAVFFVLSILLTDLWLENILENQASQAVGAKVEIDNLDFSFIGPRLSWERLQVTNPRNTMSNMIETGFCEFRMEFWPLLRGKTIIENFELSELRSGTQRETDGALPRKAEREEETGESSAIAQTRQRLEKEVQQTPQMRLAAAVKDVNVDSIISVLNLKTPGKIDSLNDALQNSYSSWNDRLQGLDFEKDLQQLKGQIDKLDPDKLKKPEEIANALKTVDNINETIKEQRTEIRDYYKNFSSEYDDWRSAFQQVDNWVQDDYRNALKMAKLPDFTFKDLARILFGESVYGQFGQYLGYVGYARKAVQTLKSGNQKEPSPPRLEGQDIYFGGATLPDFWLKKMSISGMLGEDMNLSGTMTDLTSNPPLVGQPVIINIDAANKNNKTLRLAGTLDYLGEAPVETFEMSYFGFAVDNYKLGGNSPYLPSAIDGGTGYLSTELQIRDDQVNAEIKFTAAKATFAFGKQADDKIAQIVQNSFKQLGDLIFSTRITGKAGDLDIAMRSNLDKRLADAFKQSASAEVQAAREKIEKRIRDEVDKQRAELRQKYDQYKQQIDQKVAEYDAMLKEQYERLEAEKKKLEDQKNKIADQAKDKLKDLIKKP